MKKFFKLIINIVLISILLVCSYQIYKKLMDYKAAGNVYDELKEVKENSKNEDDTIDIKYLAMQNSDYQFWIEVENTNIDYPVVQSSDNEYYLDRDFNKDYSGSGSIFMDYRNDFLNDRNTILYGHNMRNKTMFNQIEKFKEEEFFIQNNKIKISTEDSIEYYEVFSVYVSESNTDYLDIEFDSVLEFNKYINDILVNSMFKFSGTVSGNSEILTLSTCSYEFDDARTVIHARKINK